VARFYDREAGDLFLTPSDGEPLVQRPRSDHDGATPHSTGSAVLGLMRAAALGGDADWSDAADRVLRSHALLLERAPEAFPTLARAAHLSEHGLSVAVVVGREDDAATQALADRARRELTPEDAVLVVPPGTEALPGVDASWLEGRTDAARPTAWLCRGHACSLPITDPDALLPSALPMES
jgi:uncharacterized protein